MVMRTCSETLFQPVAKLETLGESMFNIYDKNHLDVGRYKV